MKKSLLFVLSFILTIGLTAQKRAAPEVVATFPMTTNLGLFQKAAPEELYPSFVDLDCADLAVIPVGPRNGGFVAGTNRFLDLAKGMRYVNPDSNGIEILGVAVPFFATDSSNVNAPVYVDIYSDPQSDGPLTLLATSDSIALKDILLPDSTGRIAFTFFTFPEPVLVENDSFLVMVDLSQTYTDSSTYTSIIHSAEGCGNGMDAYEIYIDFDADPPRPRLQTIFDGWSMDADDFDIELYMIVVYEAVTSSSTRNPLANYGAAVTPNPMSGQTSIQFKTVKPGDFALTITDFSGRRIQEMRANSVIDRGQFDVDLSAFPAGIYLYHIDGPEGRQSGKLLKN